MKQAHDFIGKINDDIDQESAQQFLGLALLRAAFLQRIGAEAEITAKGEARFTVRADQCGRDLQPGEPTESGLMTRTVWGTFKAPEASRIVIHTFGSEPCDIGVLDTVLAVYRGTAIANLSRVTGNDNKPLPGFGNTGSLVQFNTVKDADYAVQIGSRGNAEGDISLNVFRFPRPAGWRLLTRYETMRQPFQRPRLRLRNVRPAATTTFCDAKFIVHNSTNKTLTVTPSTTLGAGVHRTGAVLTARPARSRS